jgi:transcriptional regulator with XRE-family HTH domain
LVEKFRRQQLFLPPHAAPLFPRDPLLTRLRRYFGISQEELARYLGVSGPQLSRLETGQRGFAADVAEPLDALLQLLPATAPPADAAPGPDDLAAPDPVPLEARLDYCRHHARRLRRVLRPLEDQAVCAARWRAALPVLRAGLPPDPDDEPPPVSAGAVPVGRWAAFLVWYRWRWLEERPTALPPDQAARYHLLRLQAEALETEADALARLLAEPS